MLAKSLLPSLLIFLIFTPAHAKESERVVGQDWLLMSAEEKGIYIFSAMEVLRKNGVPLAKTPDQYTALIDSELIDNPNSLKIDVTNVLATVVYENESGSEEALSKITK
jgi:hypothetical protein